MAKNAGESRIPVSRAVRPSYLSKPKIVGLSKLSGLSGAINPSHRKSGLPGCHPGTELEDIYPAAPKQWTLGSHSFSSTPTEKDKRTEPNFSSAGLWGFRDHEPPHELPLQRKEEKYFGKLYGQVSMLDDVGDISLLETSMANACNETTASTLGPTQYLVLNKQNSFEHDESLGILTPDQMTDFTVALNCSRTPSCENLTPDSRLAAGGTSSSSSRASRPTDIPFVDMEASAGLCERSPSLEELPLDIKLPETKLPAEQTVNIQPAATTTVSIVPGTTTASAALPMSFVTSVTSITSLEAGYQGDGENSRPASRGPDPPSASNLPGNLPASCQACRLHDPMTDSDFFTESDADAHEDIGRGDRKAQVIDGTLFCVPGGRRCPSFTGEEMDSSGIYSDLDKRQDERFNLEEVLSEDQSPDTADTADTGETQMSQRCQTSPTTLPEVPQVIMDFLQTPVHSIDVSADITPETQETTVVHVVTETTTRSPGTKALNKTESAALKKYKMPKKNVASKIKAMIESGAKEESTKEPRRPVRAPRKSGRWDAVMSKIEAGKTEQRSRTPRKEVKSRLLQGLASASSSTSSTSSSSAATVASAKRLNGDSNNNANNKDKRRSRIRQDVSSPVQETARSSVRSSMSDLSSSAASKSTAPKRSPAAVNQQRRVVNGRNSLKSRAPNNDTKKACTLDLSPLNLDKSPTPIRSIKKQNGTAATIKDHPPKEFTAPPRISVQTRDQSAQTEANCELTQVKSAEDTVQALCLTIQYLTRQLEESSAIAQTEQQQLTVAHAKLEGTLDDERRDHQKAVDELRTRLEASLAERDNHLKNALRQEKDEFESRLKTSLDELRKEHELVMERIKSEHLLEIQAKETFWNIKNTSLNTENEISSIREEYESLKSCLKPVMALKNRVITKLKSEITDLRQQVVEKEKLEVRIRELENQLKNKSDEVKESRITNCEPTEVIDCSTLGNDQVATLRAEIWSLRSVLEIRSQENALMRSENDVLRREVESKDTLEQRVETLEARCEDLKAQLQGKDSYEREISHQNEILLGSFHEITKHNKRLTQRNEELQWRLRQKNEVVSVLANQLATPASRLSRSLGPEHLDHSIVAENNQPTSSSMIKFMVQKGDSVSWTLEIDESCDPLPSNDTPTISRQNSLRRNPRKSLDIRARSKSISASDTHDGVWAPGFNSTPAPPRRRPISDPSESSIVASATSDSNVENNSGPRPQEAGGEAMISEEASATSSEDESSASSDISRMAMDFPWVNTVE